MTERKREILQIAIELIADEGYAALTMRALARASGMKLGALQYHFRTFEDLMRELVNYIAMSYHTSFRTLRDHKPSNSLYDVVVFILDDQAGNHLCGDKLWPQLWAMQQVEPLVSDLVEDLYANYIEILQNALKDSGSETPYQEALMLISMLEGSTLFLGDGRRWAKHAPEVRTVVLNLIQQQYGPP